MKDKEKRKLSLKKVKLRKDTYDLKYNSLRNKKELLN